jgi:nucleoside-diphosphate-sugar epimerase
VQTVPSHSEDELHVIFGTGQLGTTIARELLSRGKRVRAVNRRGRAEVPSGVEVAKGDAANPDSARQASRGAAVVYNTAQPPYTEWPEKFPPILDGVIESAAAAGAKLVWADNLYMYGSHRGPLTEDLPYRATGRKGRTRARMATTLMKAHQSGKVRATIGRASNFYGPGVLDSIVGQGVFGPALRGEAAQVLGDPDALHTYTFVEDFAKALVTLGEREAALGEVWHVPSAKTLTIRRFVEMVYEEAGTTPKLRVAPKLGIAFLALFNARMRETKEILYQFEEPLVVDHGKYERAFGSDPTPHHEAIRRTLEWFRHDAKAQRATA